MDDQRLAAQYAATGNLMDLCCTDAWLQESAEIEAFNGQVEAGAGLSDYVHALNELEPERQQQIRQQMLVQSMLFTGLRQWMESWDLGAGFEETYAIARRLIRSHLASLTSRQQVMIDRLLAERQAESTDQAIHQQVVVFLSELFSRDDWQAMADAASRTIASQVLNAIPILTA